MYIDPLKAVKLQQDLEIFVKYSATYNKTKLQTQISCFGFICQPCDNKWYDL